jgi:uncharacterized spore protein YtfJ
MEDVQNLAKTTIGEIEKILNTKTVVGEPITVRDIIMIPLITTGFAFGAGGGSGKGEAKTQQGMGEGTGSGTGGGAFVKPTAIIIIDSQGVRIETVKGSLGSALEKLAERMPDVMEKCMERCMPKGGKSEDEEDKG